MRVRRPSVAPGRLIVLATRLLLAGLGVAVLLVPLPAFTGSPAAGLAFLSLPVALAVAWRPGSAWVTVLLVLAICTWIVTSLFAGSPPPLLTVGFGCLLYLVHATATFADSLPAVDRVEPVLVAWALLRLAAVVATSAAVMVAVLLAPTVQGSPLLALAGVLSALGIAGMLVVLLHRRPAG